MGWVIDSMTHLEIQALSQMEHFMCTFGLADLQWPPRADSDEHREGLGCHLGQGHSHLFHWMNESFTWTNQLNEWFNYLLMMNSFVATYSSIIFAGNV